MKFVWYAFGALAAVGLAPQPVGAATSDPRPAASETATTEKKADEPKKDRLVCTRELVSGSRTKTIKTCRKQSGWNGRDKEAGDALDEISRDR